MRLYRREFAKRVVDLVVGGFLLLLTLPILLIVALCVWVRIGWPILFCQKRAGRHGMPFPLIKFRTMTNVRDDAGRLLPDEERLTPFGRQLRASSLDELPELFNVVCGDMSLVGPRPLLMEYLPLYSEWQFRRHEVRPGLTGWAQINGRNCLDWEERFERDVWYVDNYSLSMDIRILAISLGKIIKREGISQVDHATMRPFTGSKT